MRVFLCEGSYNGLRIVGGGVVRDHGFNVVAVRKHSERDEML
jgi:hypothetical protein